MTKVCTKCEIEKPLDRFDNEKKGKYGVGSVCKDCKKIIRKTYREKNKETISIKGKAYYFKNQNKIKERHRNYNRQYYNFCITGKETEIENYELAKADNFINWERHHRLETHNSDGEKRFIQITKQELIALDMYFNRPPEELIWLHIEEHTRLHRKKVG